MPGEFGEDPRFYPVIRIGAAIEILREKLLAFRVREEVVVEDFEVLRRELAVAVPPDALLGERVDDGVLVLRAPARVHAGFRAERAAGDHLSLAARDCVLIERRLSQIPVNGREILQAELVGTVVAVADAGLLHELPPRNAPELSPGAALFPSAIRSPRDGPLEGAAP